MFYFVVIFLICVRFVVKRRVRAVFLDTVYAVSISEWDRFWLFFLFKINDLLKFSISCVNDVIAQNYFSDLHVSVERFLKSILACARIINFDWRWWTRDIVLFPELGYIDIRAINLRLRLRVVVFSLILKLFEQLGIFANDIFLLLCKVPQSFKGFLVRAEIVILVLTILWGCNRLLVTGNNWRFYGGSLIHVSSVYNLNWEIYFYK